MSVPVNIVLLGGGYVSVWAYRSLVKKLGPSIHKGNVRLTVVSPTTHHYFHGWTAEALTGVLQSQNRLSPLAKVLSKATLIMGSAEEIDTAANTVLVSCEDGSQQTLPYHHLVIGTGSYDNDAVEGFKDHGYRIKAPDDFEYTKRSIRSLIRQAAQMSDGDARELLKFTVAGGGFTGVEIASNIAEFANLYKEQYPTLHAIKPEIVLVHSGERVLNQLHGLFQKLVAYAEKQLKYYDVKVINSCRIVKVSKEGAFLSDGTFIKCSMVLSTIGQTRSVIKGTEGMQRDKVQRLYTNTFLQINEQQNIWGGGDACYVEHCVTKQACQSNALWAIKHGDYLGRNVARAVQGKALKPFTYKGLGQSASLGQGKGISELYGRQFTGWVAWMMRWFFFNYFMPSRRVMLRSAGDWLFLLVRRQRRDVWKEKMSSMKEVDPADLMFNKNVV